MKTLFPILILVTYIIYTIHAQVKIYKNPVLNKRQKILNSVMIWILPFFWFYIIKGLIASNTEIMTKKKRKKLNRNKRGGYRNFDLQKGYWMGGDY